MATLSATKTERVEMRTTRAQLEILDQATARSGLNRSDYILRTALQKAQEDLEKSMSIAIENDAFDRFIEACERAEKPNQALKEAFQFTKESDIG